MIVRLHSVTRPSGPKRTKQISRVVRFISGVLHMADRDNDQFLTHQLDPSEPSWLLEPLYFRLKKTQELIVLQLRTKVPCQCLGIQRSWFQSREYVILCGTPARQPDDC